MTRNRMILASAVGFLLAGSAFDGGGRCSACDALVRKARAVDRDGDRDCDVIVKGTDPTPGDEFEVRLFHRTRLATANARGKWKVKFPNTDGGNLPVSACGTNQQTFCNGFPPLLCGDVVGFEATFDGIDNLTVRAFMRDASRNDDTIQFGVIRSGGESGMFFNVPIRGDQAVYVGQGWTGDLRVVLLEPFACFPALHVSCGPLRERWCEFTLTEDMEVRNTCAHGTCSYKKGRAFCPDCGPSCSDEDPDCTGDTGYLVACWTDPDNGYLTGECIGTGKHTGCKCPR